MDRESSLGERLDDMISCDRGLLAGLFVITQIVANKARNAVRYM